MTLKTKVAALTVAFSTAFVGGCANMDKQQSTGYGAVAGAIVGGATLGRGGAALGAVVGGVVGNVAGADCVSRTYGTETRQTNGSNAGQFQGSQTRTTRCTQGYNVNQNTMPAPAGTEPNKSLYEKMTPQGIKLN